MASDSIHISVPEAIRSKNDTSDDDVNVHFILADGTFKLDHAVEYLKAYLTESVNIPFDEINLYLGDEFMIDPLSLSDYSAICDNSNKGKNPIFINVRS